MYSRFTPMPDGSYQRRQVPTQRTSMAPAPKPSPSREAVSAANQLDLRARLRQLLPQELELGDVLVLLVGLLLLVDAEESDQSILLTLAAFFLL